jgi:hypothetical protein
MHRNLLAALGGALALCSLITQAQSVKNDYSDTKNWLCRPGSSSDACAVDLTTTVVTADG